MLDRLVSRERRLATRPAATPATSCSDGVPVLLNALLIAEQIATTLYFTGLTTRAVVGHPYLAGASANPRQVASNGNPQNVANMRAALDQEFQHAQALARLGAASSARQFYFPAATFAGLGYTRSPGTFLWVMDRIETALIGAYLATIQAAGLRQQPDLAQLAARMLGTEAQHRVLGRIVAGDTPANNLGLEVTSFACASDIRRYLQPYLTGRGFAGGASAPIPLPAAGALARVVGT